jgi:hypothetical protein
VRPGPVTDEPQPGWAKITVVCDCRNPGWKIATFQVDVGHRVMRSDGQGLHLPAFSELPAVSRSFREGEAEITDWISRGGERLERNRGWKRQTTTLTGILVDEKGDPISTTDPALGVYSPGVADEVFPLQCRWCKQDAWRWRDGLRPILAELVCEGRDQVTLNDLKAAYADYDKSGQTPKLDARYAAWNADTPGTSDV